MPDDPFGTTRFSLNGKPCLIVEMHVSPTCDVDYTLMCADDLTPEEHRIIRILGAIGRTMTEDQQEQEGACSSPSSQQ